MFQGIFFVLYRKGLRENSEKESQFSLVQFKMVGLYLCAREKIHMRSTASLRSFASKENQKCVVVLCARSRTRLVARRRERQLTIDN